MTQPIHNKFIILTGKTDIGYVINNCIHQLILVPFGINMWLRVLHSNIVCCIILQESIWEQKQLYTSIKDGVRIPDKNNIYFIILSTTDEFSWESMFTIQG